MTRTTEEKPRPFLNKEARYQCWSARDEFFACLDKSDEAACSSLRSKFVEVCPSTWVNYFNKKRLREEYNKKLQFGYEPVDEIKV